MTAVDTTKPLTIEEKRKIDDGIAAMSEAQRLRLLKSLQPRLVEKYMVHIPHPKQQVFLSLKVREAMYGGAAGGGKALALDTPLPTPAGWTTMGAVRPGTVLYDEMGRETTVVAVSGVLSDRECYRVTFSDNTSVVADRDHRWAVETPHARSSRKSGTEESSRRAQRLHRRVGTSWKDHILTTEQIAQNLWEGQKAPRARYSIPTALPVMGDYEANLLIDPYVFGYWLGDGDTRRGYITVGDEDIEQVKHNFSERGYELVRLSTPCHYKVVGLTDALRAEGIITDYTTATPKRIPMKYMRASIGQRRDLLSGLVDSDGHVDDDIEITLTNLNLAKDVQELIVSLGIKVVMNTGKATIDGRVVGDKYRLKFMTHRLVSCLPRKMKRQKMTGFRGTHERRYIVAVEKVESVPVQCVQVDGPSHLYLAGESMVPTHNSDSLLMAALQYVDVPGYSALLLRRTWPDLSSPGAILDRARSWLQGTDAQIREGGRVWHFPSGARLTFGTLLRENDKYKFQSAEYQFIGFDELTQFDESQYTYMFSRIRRPELACLNCNGPVRKIAGSWKHTTKMSENCPHLFPDPKIINQYPPSEDGISIFDVPLRMRAATNPGGRGHEWVMNRFINHKTRNEKAVFVPAFLSDNPSLDQESYRENLGELTDVEKERLLNGDWNITESGDMFERHYFKTLPQAPAGVKSIRAWDNAATGGGGDWTVGAKVSLVGGRWVIEDIIRGQWTSAQKEAVVEQTAHADGRDVQIVMEQEPGSSGVDVIDHYQRKVLVGYTFHGERPTGSKQDRAMPFAAAAEAGNVYLVQGRWNAKFIDEAVQFPAGLHDDQVDAVTLAMSVLSRKPKRKMRILV